MQNAGPRLLIVGGGPFQLDIIDRARALGCVTLVVDGRADAPGLPRADVAGVVDIIDGPAVVDFARQHGAQAVVSAASDAALTGVAAVVEALGLPGVGPETVARCHDKLVAAEAVRAAGLAAPHTVAAATGDPAQVGGFPLVVKPSSAAGGRGVSLVTQAAQMTAAVDRAAQYGPKVLLQTFVSGESVGVEAFFRGGALVEAFVLSDQYARPFVSPIGHALPSPLAAPTRAAVVRAVGEFAGALGLTDGGANFDLRVVDGQPVLIELNPRLGGGAITQLIRLAFGADASGAAIACALGRSPGPHLLRRHMQPAASRLLVAQGRGPLRVDEDQIERLRRVPGVAVLTLDVRQGEPAPLAVDEWSVLGSCLVTGETAAAAIARAKAVAAAISSAVQVMA
ncbi:MAG: ATP-grasp domain-containing protein [Myxococcales bacterium]|nr:ATP-grasp domain-containing protein [Myxococcales bacterium]